MHSQSDCGCVKTRAVDLHVGSMQPVHFQSLYVRVQRAPPLFEACVAQCWQGTYTVVSQHVIQLLGRVVQRLFRDCFMGALR